MRTIVLLTFMATSLVAGLPVPSAWAGTAEVGQVTNLPIPRYVSLRSSKINVRRGPGLDYKKDWVYRRASLPVRVIEEYGDWRRIVDHDDAGGWVYHAMITGRRTVLITGEAVKFRASPADTAAAVAIAEQGVVARLLACQRDWCEVQSKGHEGWVSKREIWGVDKDEIFDD